MAYDQFAVPPLPKHFAVPDDLKSPRPTLLQQRLHPYVAFG